jgi:hypothetical protein
MSVVGLEDLARLAREAGALDVEGDGSEVIFDQDSLRLFAARLFELAAIARAANVVPLRPRREPSERA